MKNHRQLWESSELSDRFVSLYNSWGNLIFENKEFKLFSSVVSGDLGVSESKVREIAEKAHELGLVNIPVLNEELPQKQNPQMAGGADQPQPEIAKPDDVPQSTPEENPEEVAPEGDAEQETDEQDANSELPEKELLGSRQGVYFYVVRKSNANGDLEDVVIQDQEEEELFSAKNKGIDFQDILSLIRFAVEELDMEEIDVDFVDRYNLLEPEEEEAEEDMSDIPQGVEPAQTQPGDLGASSLGSTMESINEGREEILKKAGVGVEDWLDTGASVYFRGVSDDQARAIAAELQGQLVGTVVLDQRKFYKVILESINEFSIKNTPDVVKQYIDNHDELLRKLTQLKKEFNQQRKEGRYNHDAALGQVEEVVKRGADLVYQMEKNISTDRDEIAYLTDVDIKELATQYLQQLEEKINEEYDVVAADVEDEQTANDLAKNKQGFAVADPKQKGKFLVLKQKEGQTGGFQNAAL